MPAALMLSRSFPPLGSVGASIRLVKFLKYTSQQGWRFTVVTQHPEYTVVPERYLSQFVEDEIPAGTRVIRVPAPFISYRYDAKKTPEFVVHKTWAGKILDRLMPETSFWWGLRVFFRCLGEARTHKFDLIYATTPPFTSAWVGALLSILTHRPLVLDMKDDWVGSPAYDNKKTLRKMVDRLLERLLVGIAAKVILVTEHSYQMYQERYKRIGNLDKFHLIPNGCDLEEYQPADIANISPPSHSFTIISGAWGYRKNYRDLSPFLIGLERFLQHRPQAHHKTKVTLLGCESLADYSKQIERLGPHSIIHHHPSVDRTEFISQLRQADLLFLIQPLKNTTAISGTLYEYWASGKAPILLIAEQGASSDLIFKYNLGKHFHFDDIEGISNYLIELYDAKKNGIPVTITNTGIEQYDRRTLALQVEKIWRSCLSQNAAK